ncbi:unnamed protein product [Soboliphyme baturini]|uniref:GLOBIN domain-containing protein n=1 Tax=Soboliphyme baturini TaxID=241478 RepID=A0A183JA45_9BILA|nr:unnamed protein product [Soboliphyme baturini]
MLQSNPAVKKFFPCIRYLEDSAVASEPSVIISAQKCIEDLQSLVTFIFEDKNLLPAIESMSQLHIYRSAGKVMCKEFLTEFEKHLEEVPSATPEEVRDAWKVLFLIIESYASSMT